MENILNMRTFLWGALTVACFICCVLPSYSALFQQAADTMVVLFLLNVFLKDNIEKTRKVQTPCTEFASNRSVCADHMSLDFEESNRRLVKLEMEMATLVALVSKINMSQVRKGKVNPGARDYSDILASCCSEEEHGQWKQPFGPLARATRGGRIW